MMQNLVKDSCGSPLLEIVLKELDKKTYENFFKEHFKGKLQEMSLPSQRDFKTSNHVIQQILASAPSIEILNECIEELKPIFKECYQQNKMGIILAIFNASNNLAGKCSDKEKLHEISRAQQSLSKLILETASISVGKEWKTLVGKLLGNSDGSSDFFNYLGSMILIAMTKFVSYNSAKAVFEGFASMNRKMLLALCKSSNGSRLVESYLDSKDSIRSKNNVIKKISGSFAEVCCVLSLFQMNVQLPILTIKLTTI